MLILFAQSAPVRSGLRCLLPVFIDDGKRIYQRQHSSGVDGLREILHQLRHDVGSENVQRVEFLATLGLPPSEHSTGLDSGRSSTFSGIVEAKISSCSISEPAALVKEMLRVFTRKVPGGLVPDGLVRSFMQAYLELRGPQERLAFFHLLFSEMGLSAGEINLAVRLWYKVMAGAPGVATAAEAPQSAASSSAAARPAAPSAASAPVEGFQDTAYRAADRLSSAARPLYTQLFLPISQAPGGMKFLVDLRADLLALAAQQTTPAAMAPLRAMADHLRQSLAEWFSVGLLHLQPISWQESSAALLERVMRYEAVHPLASWEELRRRLGPRRRVFAFTHPSMPGEPLVVLHTALLDRPAASMGEILEEPQRREADGTRAAATATSRDTALPPRASPPLPPPTTAVFYSISASQPGLHGIDLGQFLIKRVAEVLLAEHPSIRQLVTLSPLPNFRSWLISRLRQEQAQGAQPQPGSQHAAAAAPAGVPAAVAVGSDAALLSPPEAVKVVRLARALGWDGVGAQASALGGGGAPAPAPGQPSSAAAAAALCWLLDGDRWLAVSGAAPSDVASGATEDSIGGPGGSHAQSSGGLASSGGRGDLGRRTAGPRSDTRDAAGDAEEVVRPLLLRLAGRYLVVEKRRRFALCPVAHFHLRNGASLWRLNWRADMSPLGLQRSLGVMVNYNYDLPAVFDNNRKYLMQHEVHAHLQVMDLLKRFE